MSSAIVSAVSVVVEPLVISGVGRSMQELVDISLFHVLHAPRAVVPALNSRRAAAYTGAKAPSYVVNLVAVHVEIPAFLI